MRLLLDSECPIFRRLKTRRDSACLENCAIAFGVDQDDLSKQMRIHGC